MPTREKRLTLSLETQRRIKEELARWEETTDIETDNAVALKELLESIERAANGAVV